MLFQIFRKVQSIFSAKYIFTRFISALYRYRFGFPKVQNSAKYNKPSSTQHDRVEDFYLQPNTVGLKISCTRVLHCSTDTAWEIYSCFIVTVHNRPDVLLIRVGDYANLHASNLHRGWGALKASIHWCKSLACKKLATSFLLFPGHAPGELAVARDLQPNTVGLKFPCTREMHCSIDN